MSWGPDRFTAAEDRKFTAMHRSLMARPLWTMVSEWAIRARHATYKINWCLKVRRDLFN